MKTSSPSALKAHAMAFNPQITLADAVKQGLLVPAKIPFLAGYSVIKREHEPFKIVCNANGALAAEVYGHNAKDDTGGAQSLALLYAATPALLALHDKHEAALINLHCALQSTAGMDRNDSRIAVITGKVVADLLAMARDIRLAIQSATQ